MKIRPTPSARPARHHSDAYVAYLDSPAWRATRAAAIRRAGRRCSTCGATGPLEVHHRHYRTLGAEAWADLVVLCPACHQAADQRRRTTTNRRSRR